MPRLSGAMLLISNVSTLQTFQNRVLRITRDFLGVTPLQFNCPERHIITKYYLKILATAKANVKLSL
jgi:hypothetical protein